MIAKKILLVGNFGVGKTSLIDRFVANEFLETYISTIGVRVSTKVILEENHEVKLLIWDVAGINENEKIPDTYFLGASAILYVFDLTREETYKNIEKEIASILEVSDLKRIFIVGNKKDALTSEELEVVLDSIPVNIDFLSSAKDDYNINKIFRRLAIFALN